MADTPIARGSSTRTANMNKRRHQILSCAGKLIAADGIEAFTLKRLAQDAEVTVPTIHNLIGKKSDIFEKLVEDMVRRVEEALNFQTTGDPITAAETSIDKLMELFSGNETFYKAAFVAGERIDLFEHTEPGGIFASSLNLAIQVCQLGREQGYLQGEIDTSQLAHEVFGCQRLARHDWVQGYIDLKTYRRQALAGMFIIFAADATADYRVKLLERINSLQ